MYLLIAHFNYVNTKQTKVRIEAAVLVSLYLNMWPDLQTPMHFWILIIYHGVLCIKNFVLQYYQVLIMNICGVIRIDNERNNNSQAAEFTQSCGGTIN